MRYRVIVGIILSGLLSGGIVLANVEGTTKTKDETTKEEIKGEQSKEQNSVKIKEIPQMKPETTPNVDSLLQWLEKTKMHPSNLMRWKVLCALGQTKDPRAYEPLVKYFWSGDSNDTEAAAIGLGSLGDKRATEELKKVLNAREDKKMKEVIKEQRVRYEVANSLLDLDETEVSYAEIEKLLKEGYARALWSLIEQNLETTGKRTIKDKHAKELMLKAMKSSDDEVRVGAAYFALETGICEKKEARKIANDILKTTTNERARDKAKGILEKLGDKVEDETDEMMRKILEDEKKNEKK